MSLRLLTYDQKCKARESKWQRAQPNSNKEGYTCFFKLQSMPRTPVPLLPAYKTKPLCEWTAFLSIGQADRFADVVSVKFRLMKICKKANRLLLDVEIPECGMLIDCKTVCTCFWLLLSKTPLDCDQVKASCRPQNCCHNVNKMNLWQVPSSKFCRRNQDLIYSAAVTECGQTFSLNLVASGRMLCL